MVNSMILKGQPQKKISRLSEVFYGTSPDGTEISFTNYYMELNREPFYGISGEFHFSRCNDSFWEDEIIKMKMCGINIISTYIFWIHHEEIEGTFDFKGCRNLKKFVELCKKHGMYVIVRIGPFDHGEVRNGGIPDWMFGKPYEVRSTNPGFLAQVRKLYQEISNQLKGMLFKEGGCVIAAQIDNEYMHSSAPWEITTGVANEWINGGHEGDEYMLALQTIAKECGIDVPFYTCTGWGGAATPDNMLPLWGGYAFRPWLFYSHKGEHPATEEYIYRDNHNDTVPKTFNFEPRYKPESKPYACCEMGGGMMCSYNYRFQLPYKSVDAMANIKMASGCNFLGYYMFKGGTNPKGKKSEFVNESQAPKMSYDYQAALGEFGQIRESYSRLKCIHLFSKYFGKDLCGMKTFLPDNSQLIKYTDVETLRYAVRMKEKSGFLFINNYQDHVDTKDKANEEVRLELDDEIICFQNLSIEKDENCILPFNMDLSGFLLKKASAQPLIFTKVDDELYYFFFTPAGMKPYYVFDANVTVLKEEDLMTEFESSRCEAGVQIKPQEGRMTSFIVRTEEHRIHVVTLTREQSLQLFTSNIDGKEVLFLSEDALLVSEDRIRIQTNQPATKLCVFPKGAIDHLSGIKASGQLGLFEEFHLSVEERTIIPEYTQIGPTRYVVKIPNDCMDGVKEAILKIDYLGDIGQAFIDGDMISDNFCNGAAWEIGLSRYVPRLKEKYLTIYITPLKEGVNVNVESSMAARLEEVSGIKGEISSISIQPVYEITM